MPAKKSRTVLFDILIAARTSQAADKQLFTFLISLSTYVLKLLYDKFEINEGHLQY